MTSLLPPSGTDEDQQSSAAPPGQDAERATAGGGLGGVGLLTRHRFLGLWVGTGAALGLVFVLAKGANPLLALGAGAGAALVYAAVIKPTVALVLLLVVEWSNLSDVVGYHSGLSLYLIVLALAVVSLALAVRPQRAVILPRSPLYLLLFLAVAANGLSLAASRYPIASLSLPLQRLKDLGFLFAALGLMQLTGRWGTALRTVVITVAVLAGLSLVQEFLLHNSTTFGGLETVPHTVQIGGLTARHNGPQGDPNFWGRTIVLATPPALALFSISLRDRSWSRAGMWLMAILLLLGGEYLTQSRGDLLAMLLLLVLWTVVVGRRHRRRLILLPVAILLLFMVVPGLSSRLGSLTQLSHVSSARTDLSLVGRVQAQKVGLAMFKSDPITGVGLGEFQAVEPAFLTAAGQQNTGVTVDPHDLYLELAAEEGIVGLGAWTLFFGGALLVSLRAALLARRIGADNDSLLAMSCLIGLVGWATASVVLHMNFFGDLLAVMAIAVVIDSHVRSRARSELTEDVGPGVGAGRSRGRWGVIAAAIVLGAAVAFVAASTLPLYRTTYRAQVTASVRPVHAPAGGNDAYTWNTVSRESLLPTFGAIAANRQFVRQAEGSLRLSPAQTKSLIITGIGDAADAVLGVRVTADRPEIASAVAAQTFVNSRGYLAGVLSLYEIEPLSPAVVVPERALQPSVVGLIAGLVFATLLGVWLVFKAFRWRHWRSTQEPRRTVVATP